jgi:5-methylcytosine-specific restriction endonuclease McrA
MGQYYRDNRDVMLARLGNPATVERRKKARDAKALGKTYCRHHGLTEVKIVGRRGVRCCRICITTRTREYQRTNEGYKAKQHAKKKIYYQENAEHFSTVNRIRRQAMDPQYLKDRSARWRRDNPEICRANHQKGKFLRRSRLASVRNDLTFQQWALLLKIFGNRCAYCFQPSSALTQDHIIPVALGGPHTLTNVVPACSGCNTRKSTKVWKPLLKFGPFDGLLKVA